MGNIVTYIVMSQKSPIIETLEYNQDEFYYTVKKENGKTVKEGFVQEYEISERISPIVPYDDFDDWLSAVLRFIKNENKKLSGKKVTFEITGKRDNGTYMYNKKLDGNAVKSGVAGCSDIPKNERREWKKSVKNFCKENKIELPFDKSQEELGAHKKNMSEGNKHFGKAEGGDDIKLGDILAGGDNVDICTIVSKIIELTKKGLPKPKDPIQNSMMKMTSEFNLDLNTSANGATGILKPFSDKVTGILEKYIQSEADEDNDVELEEAKKSLSTEITLTEEVLADDSLEEENTPTIMITTEKYEIPEEVMQEVNKAMNARFKGGVPEDTKKRYNEYKEKYFNDAFNGKNVPIELSLLCIIESNAKNLNYENSCTAAGMWQIIRPVANQYGLLKAVKRSGVTNPTNKDYIITSDYDYRYDVKKATNTAATMLRDIRRARTALNKWIYVAAAYNTGGGNATKAVKKAGGNEDVWKVVKQLPTETKNYVYCLIGLCKEFGYGTDKLFE